MTVPSPAARSRPGPPATLGALEDELPLLPRWLRECREMTERGCHWRLVRQCVYAHGQASCPCHPTVKKGLGSRDWGLSRLQRFQSSTFEL